MTKKTESRIPLDDLLVFHQITRSLTSSFDLDTILRTIIVHMERFIDADLWTLLMLDESRQELYYAITEGEEDSALRNLRVKVGEGIAGWVAEHGETLLVPETENDPRLKKALGDRSRVVRSVIALPLRGRKGTHGVIEIFNPRSEQLTDYTIAFLHILADHAAIAIENARDVARIQQLTITDDCTGLYNVRHLYDVLSWELERCSQPERPVSLAFLDLDHFKLVNDEHGHLVGSELLARVGERLRELSRKQDWCFRYGGDEFVIVLPQASKENAFVVARRLHKLIGETHWLTTEGLDVHFTASIGVASYPTDAKSKVELLHLADEAMYAIKNSTRDGVAAAKLGVLPVK